ncbi:DUF2069 domain-containing protein [Idiomarina sp. 29L]|uniref:DUF2069 domain-containing protein n=1 Tax=Idiomarina sp. 29L TaxID=2508877 RepID=UPI001013779B|nr:DUF2069 domain-containing protein [Idiomarina sp. 29L]RXS44585.1 DUF2069 domain-containing protein [Idiomarina sp. 29L]
MPKSPQFYRVLTHLCYWPLLILVLLWHSLPDSAPASLPTILSLLFWVLPLLFPLPGLIRGKPYTHAWANFILMLYFLHALTTLWTHPDERIWAALELLFAVGAFIGATGFARYKGRELGLGLKKLKDQD